MATPQNSTPVRRDARKLQKRLLRNDIEETLLKFKFNDLTGDTILSIFELEPVEINHKLNELKLPFNKHSMAILLSHRGQAFQLEELQNIRNTLLLYRTAFCSKLKKWTPVNLLEPTDNFYCEGNPRLIRRNLLQAFRIKGLNAEINVVSHDDMIWLMIIEKKLTRRKGIKLQTPVFGCYEVGTPYIFVASKVPTVIMECILKAMQYTKHKLHHLEGKDVKSLLTILKNKATNRDIVQLATYQPAEAEIGYRKIDFSKSKARESYADKLFPKRQPIQLESFSVYADATWRDNSLVPEMCGQRFETSLQLSSKNVINMIKYMMVNNIIATPLPDYLQTIMRNGKNKISMRATSKNMIT